MKSFTAKAFALGAVAVLGGCTAMPEVEPAEQSTERALRVGEPFVYQTAGEPLDAGAATTSLSLEQAVQLSLKHHPQIQVALARVRQAEADARQTRLLPNPVIGVAYRFPEAGGKSVIDADISADLLSLFTRPGRIAAVDNRLRRASSDALKVVLDVVLDVQRSYADAQALDAKVSVGNARRSILQGLLDTTNARLRAGEAARLDVLTAQSELSALDAELVALRSEQRLARLTLGRLIGQPSASAAWELPAWSVTPMPALSESEWIRVGLEHRPELKAIQWELAALGQEVRLAKLDKLLTGDAGISAERDDIWSIGPSFSIPIPLFDTGAVARQRLVDQVIEQRHELTQTSRVVVEEVRRAFETLNAARAGLDRVQSELLPLQEQRLQQAQASYRAGLTDILALRLAEQDLQQARARVIDLQQQVAKARFELDRAVGGSGAYLNDTDKQPAATRPASSPTE